MSEEQENMTHGKHMKLWGILSEEDEDAGFEVVMDTEWYILIKEHGKVLTRLNPSVCTLPQLHSIVDCFLRISRGELTDSEIDYSQIPGMSVPEISFLAMLRYCQN